jgi:F-type H+-transporting ATPase subunit epsilon
MTVFTLHLQDARHYERIEGVTSFVGEDASGQFGLLAGHERMMTSLTFGLMRYRVGSGEWEYVAVPGGILYFIDNELFLSARSYHRDSDYRRITAVLGDQLRAEEETLRTIKQSLHRMEEEMLKRLWRMGRGELKGL